MRLRAHDKHFRNSYDHRNDVTPSDTSLQTFNFTILSCNALAMHLQYFKRPLCHVYVCHMIISHHDCVVIFSIDTPTISALGKHSGLIYGYCVSRRERL